MKLIEGKVAIVTGSGRGIGRAVAELLARHGARVVINDLDPKVAEEAAQAVHKAGGETLVCAGSVTDPDFPNQLIKTTVDRFKALDIIVNNAGYTYDGVIHKMSDEQWYAMIDCHLTGPFRILRAVKNRFGSTNEIGVFEMNEAGLSPVANPSALFLAERPVDVPGSVVIASIEGTRPILVELQALVSPSSLGTPRRTTLGMDHNRVALLVAILEKKMGLQLIGHDIFLNIAGGVRLDEPAADLGAVLAVASSFLNRPVDPHTLIAGEVGLAGEVRAIGLAEARVREGAKLGFKRCILPESSRRQLPLIEGVELRGVQSLNDAWELLF